MAKFYGEIGYAIVEETTQDVYVEQIKKRSCYGEFVRNTSKLQTSGNINDDINVSSEISILADPYSLENFHTIRYVTYMGSKWKVNSVEVKYPRLVLTLGGLYNV